MTDTVKSLTAELDALFRTAEQRFRAQPRPTRHKLSAETRSIFQQYAQHGSQARLRHHLKAYLETGAEGMTFAESTPPQPQPQPQRQLQGAAKSDTVTATATAPPHDVPIAPSDNPEQWDELQKDASSGGGGGGVVDRAPPSLRTVDTESSDLITAPPTGLAFHLDRSFVLDVDTRVPPDLLESMDRIFGLYANEATRLLRHHCEKYGCEPVFRAGIREFVMSRTDTLFHSVGRHDLGLTPETQEFLFSVYERRPDLNVAETRMLVRVTRLDEDTIELFWEDMTQRRKSYLAMRQLIVARELRELRAERAQGPA